jgi:HTH-type transcriptional regulator/antitoxin HigA
MKPISAGIFLKNLLIENGIGQIILAQDTGLTTKTINSICKGKAPITPKVAVLFEKYLPPQKAEFWLVMEMKHKLSLARSELEESLIKAKSDLEKARAEYL